MTQLEIVDSWILSLDEEVEMGFTLVLVQTGIMIMIIIILRGGVKGDIFRMSSRKQSHLHLMGK